MWASGIDVVLSNLINLMIYFPVGLGFLIAAEAAAALAAANSSAAVPSAAAAAGRAAPEAAPGDKPFHLL